MTEEKRSVAREFYIMSPTLEQEFNGAKQYVRMCIEIPHFRSNFSGEYFIAIDKTAYQQALEQIAKLGLALEKINIRVQHYKDKDVGHQCNSKVGCQSASDISREALAELKKWRGE